jgi:transcriptional regulator with XRE-family HTH domain
MLAKLLSNNVLLDARARAGLSQRALARRAGTAQSVVARIELGATSPTTETLQRLIDAAGFELRVSLQPKLLLDPQELDDVPRILGLTPEQRLREVANIDRFLVAARRG